MCNDECCKDLPGGSNNIGNCTRTPAGKCVVACDANCAKAKLRCPLNGACTAEDGNCVVASDADCKKSKSCTQNAQCTQGFHGEGCIKASMGDAFCKGRDSCKLHGACEAANGNCVNPDKPTDCKHTYMCKSGGWCSWDGNKCRALTLADCAEHWCGAHCAIKFGKCILEQSDEACAAQENCKLNGWCHFKDGKCTALSQADCDQSTQCQKYGRCKYTEQVVGGVTGRRCCDDEGKGCQ